MPDAIRTTGGGIRACLHRRGLLIIPGAATAWGGMLTPAPALDADLVSITTAVRTTLATLDRHEIAALALILGVMAFAVVSATSLMRIRGRAARDELALRSEIAALKGAVDRANALLLSEPQLIVIWEANEQDPEIVGDHTIVMPAPTSRRALAFGTWLPPEKALIAERAVEALRLSGESFSMASPTLASRYVEIEGRAIAGRAVLRLKDVSGTQRDLTELASAYRQLTRETNALRTLAEALPAPIWERNGRGKLTWVNPAYVSAVEAPSANDVVACEIELLDRTACADAMRAHQAGSPYQARLPVVAAGRRRVIDVFDVPAAGSSIGIALDATEGEGLRAEMAHMVEAHRRVLDQLTTAVAIFNGSQRLAFYNAAYCTLWNLGSSFLDQQPTDAAVLEQLRSTRKLPEQTDFRHWRSQLHEAYHAIEPREYWWHLPDGRTLRVVTTPNPEGGVTYLFDDVTERLDLERRYDALIRVQGETLDNLAEAVALFASDGRLRLHNPAFAHMWRLSATMLSERPHIETVIAGCRALHPDDQTWQALRTAITGFEREVISGRLERLDGSVVDCATMPLADGATLVTFQEVTDTVNVERALRERNEALEAASELKNDFVHHVSYELRSPLTNVIGFAQLLNDETAGPLTEKQSEYLRYITSSSAALLAIINDILDLATIDAGVMTLDLGAVAVRNTMEAAAEGVKDRLVENRILLDIRTADNVGSFIADQRRVRQVLYNLLSNAVDFAPPDSTVTLSAERRPDAVIFTVVDRGPGIPADVIERVFERFETHTRGSRHHGAGLGLSIVRSLVELHGGAVTLASAPGQGTTVTCVFPLDRASVLISAA